MTRPKRVATALLLLAGVLTTSLAHSTPDRAGDDSRNRSAALLREGARAYNEGRYADAVDRLLQARKLYAEPVLLYNLGRAYEKLGRSSEAANVYERYLAEAPNAADRKAIEATIEQLRRASSSSPPAAVGTPEQCAEASETAQLKRDHGALIEARERLLVCAAEACPRTIRKDCVEWLTEIEARIPTVVLTAKDANGTDLLDVSVFVDGKPFATRLSAAAIPVDPGEHVFRFERKSGPPVEARIVAREGERRRQVVVVLAATPSSARSIDAPVRPVTSSARAPLATWILGGVAVAGLGSFGYFLGTGLSDRGDLEGTCSPTCSKNATDDVARKLLAADVSLGVAGVAAIAAVAIYLVAPGATPPR